MAAERLGRTVVEVADTAVGSVALVAAEEAVNNLEQALVGAGQGL